MNLDLEAIAVRRSDEQLAGDPRPSDKGCWGTGKRPTRTAAPRFPPVPMLIRLSPRDAARLRALVARTRVSQATYLREAVAALLERYEVES